MAEMQYDLGLKQLEAQQRYADQATARSDEYFQMSKDAEAWGREQFNTIWPYALDYMNSQASLSTLAGENASEAILSARLNRQISEDTYRRYQSEFVPLEQEFTKQAQTLGSVERQTQASGQAQADVATAFAQQQKAREQELRNAGIDPSEARYQGESALAGIGQAAAQAGAGTQARRQQEALGLSAMQQAIAMGQKLPTLSLAQLEAATQSAQGGISGGQVGGGGVTGATSLYGQGAAAGGSPTAYGYLGGPSTYSGLAGMSGTSASSLYGGANTLLGSGVPNAINAGAGALNSSFSNQMSGFNAEQKQQEALWGGMGKLVGGVGSAALGSPWVGAALGFSDRRLKEDDRVVGHIGRLPLHAFRYKGRPEAHLGYMADEVELLDPSAVVMHESGYKAVDYNRATMSALGS